MEKHKLTGTIKVFSGVAEELLGTKTFFVRAGLFKDVDIMLGAHVHDELEPSSGEFFAARLSFRSVFLSPRSRARSRSAMGRSQRACAVELIDTGWNFRREHLRLQQRSHYVIINGGDQPNVVPSEAGVWSYFRELDYPRIKDLYELGNAMARPRP